ncbi:MAG: Crp/Fnr family transcriptional regulator [Candidatus Elarobacter sp.]
MPYSFVVGGVGTLAASVRYVRIRPSHSIGYGYRRMISNGYDGGNLLIDALPPSERARVIEQLTVFEPDVPDCVVARNERFRDVLFPIDAVFSITAELRRGEVYEVAAVGREGVIGAELALDMTVAPRSVMSQVGGRSARMTGAAFGRFYAENRAFSRGVHRHLIHRLFIAEQLIACNFAHDLTQRCARWILMFRDQVGRDDFSLREEFLGIMLAVSTREASRATRPLQNAGALRYENERVAIVDAAMLLEASCECYAAQRRYAPAAFG